MELSKEAIEKRRAYQREYYRKNRDRLREYNKNWREENKDKVKGYVKNYWERKVSEGGEEMKELTIMEEHLSEVEQRTSRITELNRGIENDIEKLNTLKGNYKQSVANDLDDVDNLYHEMNDLDRKIEADKHKLATLKDVTDEHLKKSALSVLS